MRWKLAVGWVAVQVAFFAAWAGVEQRRLSVGYPIHVRTAPVDPRDLLRGQYLELSYEFSRAERFADTGERPKDGDEVWFLLRSEGEFHVPVAAYSRRLPGPGAGQVLIAGRMEGWRIVYGIEQYFVPEGLPTPARSDTTVRLRVGQDGKPRIETVMVKGVPWP